MPLLPRKDIASAIRHFWETRASQGAKQGALSGVRDAGNRALVTGGRQMAGFEAVVTRELIKRGIPADSIFHQQRRDLPGYFRPEKNWDLLVIHQGTLLGAIEFKSQIGSFGNNFNNRTEEALGNATDLWTAYREGAYGTTVRPWLGFLMLLEDVPAVHAPARLCESHFHAFPEFQQTSYAQRYALLLRRLVLERLYDAACLILSNQPEGLAGKYREPDASLGFGLFCSAFVAHCVRALELLEQG